MSDVKLDLIMAKRSSSGNATCSPCLTKQCLSSAPRCAAAFEGSGAHPTPGKGDFHKRLCLPCALAVLQAVGPGGLEWGKPLHWDHPSGLGGLSNTQSMAGSHSHSLTLVHTRCSWALVH